MIAGLVNCGDLMKYAQAVREQEDFMFLPEILEDCAREIEFSRRRIIELESQLAAEAEKRAEYERNCG